MVAQTSPDLRDSHVVEIEFNNVASAVDFIAAVNAGDVAFLRSSWDVRDQIRVGFAFAGAPTLVDSLQPKRNVFVAVSTPHNRNTDDIARILRLHPNVKAAARRPMFLPATLRDPYIGESDLRPPEGEPPTQWYIHRCATRAAWKNTLGKDIVVADIDWGFYLEHEDLAGRYDANRLHNALDGSTEVSIGDISHGTGSAGQIGAATNEAGIAGFAPECTLWLVQAGIVGDNGPEPPPDLVNPWASAIDWVIARDETKRKVINLEVQTGRLYSAESSVCIQGAIRRAVQAGVFVCVPAGNGEKTVDQAEDGQPIPDTGSIVVAATGYDHFINPPAGFTNYGKRVRLAAPGEPDYDLTCGIGSTRAYTKFYGGTSGAAAKAAGALALMLGRNPQLTHKQLLAILSTFASPGTPSRPIGGFLRCDVLADAAHHAQQSLARRPTEVPYKKKRKKKTGNRKRPR